METTTNEPRDQLLEKATKRMEDFADDEIACAINETQCNLRPIDQLINTAEAAFQTIENLDNKSKSFDYDYYYAKDVVKQLSLLFQFYKTLIKLPN